MQKVSRGQWPHKAVNIEGFSTERVVARYLSEWWPHADIGRGAGKDITHVPFDMEVKARSAFQPKHGSIKSPKELASPMTCPSWCVA
jgi:hypothetical protein